jgi:hypothetical protein
MKAKQPDWSVYDRFIETSFPVLMGISEYEVLDEAYDRICPFFYDGIMSEGARKISIIANLQDNINLIDKNTFSLEITDFWRNRGGGYIDRLSVTLEGGMKFSSFELDPSNAKKPNLYFPQELGWDNSYYDARPPKKIRLVISMSP